jgi:acetyl-CoA C-acetyltransferase
LDSAAAWEAGKFDAEIVPVEVPQRRGDAIVITKDEEFTNVKLDKIPSLAAVFTKEGTVTAANASTINDGAAALVLMSEEKAQSLGLKPLAYIKSYADAAQEPKWFTTAPAKALPKALDKAGISISDVDFFEFNEAFAVVGLANAQILGLDNDKINVNGGAVSLGHPLGCSGARIIVTLINVLNQNNAKIGAAAICNGGGGASGFILSKENDIYLIKLRGYSNELKDEMQADLDDICREILDRKLYISIIFSHEETGDYNEQSAN